MTSADRDILARVAAGFQAKVPDRLGVAVSGGSDSLALLYVLHRLFAERGIELRAATVDHGLRPEARQEAERVARISRSLSIPHDILTWQGWDKKGNLQAEARKARYALLAEWAGQHRLGGVVLGHTADDQAETFLMRLGRASGVDGLSAMRAHRVSGGVPFLRPVLRVRRAELRGFLRRMGQDWAEDPSNSDTRFARVRARKAMEELNALGISATTLGDVAENLAYARDALDWYTFTAARDLVEIDGGDVVIELRRFRTLPVEIARRLLVGAIGWITGADYAPRRAAMMDFVDAARRGRSATLGGCRLLRQGQLLWVCREFGAVRGRVAGGGEVWDGRWRTVGSPAAPNSEIRPLGTAGLGQCPDWRASGRPWVSLIASPALWLGDILMAAPLADKTGPVGFELLRDGEEFFAGLLSH